MRAKRGDTFILIVVLLAVTAACGAGDGAPTTETARSAVGPAATVSATATSKSVAADSHTSTDANALSRAEIDALLEANQCRVCHVIGAAGNSLAGPSLNGLAERIETYGLSQSAEAYVHASLVNPAAYLPDSCPTGQCANVMPSYATRLSADELNALVAFLLSLPAESS